VMEEEPAVGETVVVVEPEPPPAAEQPANKPPDYPVNPRPCWRGVLLPGRKKRRIFYLRDPNRVRKFEQFTYGSLRELIRWTAESGAGMPLVEIERMKGLHTERGGMAPGDVFIFLYEDFELVSDHAKSRPQWARGVYVHCVADEATNIKDVWQKLLDSGCDQELLHIVTMYGGYMFEESLYAAGLLWTQIKDIYLLPREDKKSRR
jgi:hypothetical protein